MHPSHACFPPHKSLNASTVYFEVLTTHTPQHTARQACQAGECTNATSASQRLRARGTCLHSHGREPVCLHSVRVPNHGQVQPHKSHEAAFRGQAVCLHSLRLPSSRQVIPHSSSAEARRGGETVSVSQLRLPRKHQVQPSASREGPRRKEFVGL